MTDVERPTDYAPSRIASSSLPCLLAALLLGPPPADARKAPRIPCPGGVFQVVGDALVPGGAQPFEDLLQVGGGTVSTTSGCQATRVKQKVTKRGTRLKASWGSCPGLAGRVKMKAFIDPLTCATVTGMLRAKRYRRPFQALLQQLVVPPIVPPSPPEDAVCGNGAREDYETCDDGNTASCDGCAADCFRHDARCGDGIVECDEQCDGYGCGADERCEDCRCVPDDSAATCAEASTCDIKHYCGNLNCRCIQSAEGVLGCGSVPSCDVPKCSTSADCAPLGDGYFCDTPNSGCCSDGHLPRCIAPCDPVPDPDNVLPAQSIDIQRLFVEVAKAKRGASADLDGDGTPDVLVATLPDGSVTTSSPPDAGGRSAFASRLDPAGEETTLVDRDLDGVTETEVRFAPGPPPVRVTETDTDGDGVKDRRETATYDVVAATVRLVREDDPEPDGTFVVVADTTEPIGRDAGTTKCNGAEGFPIAPSLGSRLRFGGAGDISIPYNDDGGGGRCTKPRAQRISTAVSCALDKGFKCLERTNDALSKQLFSTMVRETLYFGCGNPCAGTDATTIPWLRVPGFRDGKINFNPTQLDAMTDEELCGVTLHEMLHWAGEGLQGAADHDQGTDRTYSCGRYCGGCITRGPDPAAHGQPSGPNADCARCAGTEAEKARCGLKKQEQDMFCPEYNLCHAGLAGNIQCAECRGTKQLFCDDTETSIPLDFRCCKSCPSGYPTNDKPCFGDSTSAASCAHPPPDCR